MNVSSHRNFRDSREFSRMQLTSKQYGIELCLLVGMVYIG